MGRRVTRIATCVALWALATGGLGAGAAWAAPGSASARATSAATPIDGTPLKGVVAPVPVATSTGTYIVLLDEEPLATYRGGVRGFAATAPPDGEKLDTHSTRAQRYTAYLATRQRDVAETAGVEPLATYQTVLNGFSAQLTPDAASRVAATDGVRVLYADEIFRPDGAPSVQAPPAPASAATAAATAADGVVVGVIDTGIAPGNPSFAGDRLTTSRAAGAYLEANTVVVPKADDREFRSPRLIGEDWTRSDYSTKLVAAQYFAAGAEAAEFDFTHDALSPRDSDGHGSSVASIAAGNAAVNVQIDGAAFGSISGAAPDARIASYKACYVGHDPLSSTDDICAGTDVLAALDRAVSEGVDVVAFSLGEERAEQEWGAPDIALYNAAVAGVFVAVSAGNGGPGPGTARDGAPWYTTVAASTDTTFAATVVLAGGLEASGVSASVRAGEQITAPIVYAADAALAGSADARLCSQGSLDPQLVEGRIVVCDRGTYPRDEKAREVAETGGVGMVLVNVGADSLDAETDAVPSVHVDGEQRDALLTAVRAGTTATLTRAEGGDTPPRIAGFSGRGPSSHGDVLSPDVAAPGVSILAAGADASDGEPTWSIASGTSVAAPAVAGLAAAYLAAHPGTLPDEVKSALMTTAGDAVDADSSFAADPFAQGAGSVDDTRLLDPGLLYLNGPAQWRSHLQQHGRGGADPSGVPGEAELPSGEVNLASISIPQLAQKQLVTRTLTATRAGTYEVAASIPGVEVTVNPATLTFGGAGETKTYTVAFTNESAPVGLWVTGFLVWTETDGTGVRSPLAVRPAAAAPTSLVTGEGAEGSADAQVVSGATGELTLDPAGLAPVELLVDPDDPAPGHSGDAASGDANGRIAWTVSVPADSALAEFTLATSADDELDLTVHRLAASDADADPDVEGGAQQYVERFEAEATADHQRVTLPDPVAGDYLIVVDLSDAAEGTTWDLTSAVITAASRSLSVTAESSTVAAGEVVPLTVSWTGLQPRTDYIGVVRYGDSPAHTVVRVAAGSTAPTADGPPVITGDPVIGERLRVESPEWDADDLSISYRWLRDGEPIDGADESEYLIRAVDAGTSLSAEAIARRPGAVNAGVAVSDPVVVNAPSMLEVTTNRSIGTAADRYAVTVAVATTDGAPAAGTVTVQVDTTAYIGTLAGGTVTFVLAAPTPGIHVVVAEYAGAPGLSGSSGVTGFVVRD
jgi:subtilisin family serine protease